MIAPLGADFGGGNMRRSFSKAVGAALVALAMGLCSTTPSLAFHGGFSGLHGGFGGFHSGPGGFHPGFGGFRPGFRPGFVGFYPGFGGRRFFFHRGFFRNGVWVNGWWGPAVITTAWWGGYDGCWTYRAVYDAAGAYLGYSYVNTCS
jgi:hypothetical protein